MKKIIYALLVVFVMAGCSATRSFKTVDVDAFSQLLTKKGVVCLDVRTPSEYAEGSISGAVNINVKDSQFEQKADSVLSKGAKVAVFCRSGRRSAAAAEILAKKGYKVYNLKGGIIAWRERHQ